MILVLWVLLWFVGLVICMLADCWIMGVYSSWLVYPVVWCFMIDNFLCVCFVLIVAFWLLLSFLICVSLLLQIAWFVFYLFRFYLFWIGTCGDGLYLGLCCCLLLVCWVLGVGSFYWNACLKCLFGFCCLVLILYYDATGFIVDVRMLCWLIPLWVACCLLLWVSWLYCLDVYLLGRGWWLLVVSWACLVELGWVWRRWFV